MSIERSSIIRRWDTSRFFRGVSLFFLFCFCLCVCQNAEANDLIFKAGYTCTDSEGEKRWGAVSEIRPSMDEADGLFLFTETGEGVFGRFKEKVSWVTILEYEETKDSLRPIRMEKRIFDKEKRLLGIETQEFDHSDNKVRYSYEETGTGKKKEESFSFKGDIVNRLMLGLYIQKFLKDERKEGAVYLLCDQPALYRIGLEVVAKEQIEIGSRKLSAYKICLSPDIGIFNLFKAFASKGYTWHAAEGDFRWLKYKGPETDPYSIRVEIITDEWEP